MAYYNPKDELEEHNNEIKVIDDTPIEKGWRERWEKIFINRDYLGIKRLNRIFVTNHKLDENIDISVEEVVLRLEKFIEEEVEQAYVRGQEEAYRKSAEKIKSFATTRILSIESSKTGKNKTLGYHKALKDIAQAIEQLASNKE